MLSHPLLFMQFFKLVFFYKEVLFLIFFEILLFFSFLERNQVLLFEILFCYRFCSLLGHQIIIETFGVGSLAQHGLVSILANIKKPVGVAHVPWRLFMTKLRFRTIIKCKFFVRKSFIHVCLVLTRTWKPSSLRPLRFFICLSCLLFL